MPSLTTKRPILPPLAQIPQLKVVHYLISESSGKHVAHCLDLDLVSVGGSLQEASRNLDALVKAQIEFSLAKATLENLKTSAPHAYWKLFIAGRPVELEPKTIHITVPESIQVVPLDSSEGEVGILARAAAG